MTYIGYAIQEHFNKTGKVPNNYEETMKLYRNPLTKTGKKILVSMEKEYGKKKGKKVFYSSINKKKAGSSKWHR